MTPAARLQAAIEILETLEQRPRPISETLKDWGKSHRFAGSKDRSVIGNIVYDIIRKKNSLAFLGDKDGMRHRAFTLMLTDWGVSLEELQQSLKAPHAPAALTESEKNALLSINSRDIKTASPHIRGNYPEHLDPYLSRAFGEDRVLFGEFMAERAPIDIRVNPKKATLESLENALNAFQPQRLKTPHGLRIPHPTRDTLNPKLEFEEGFQRGWFEIQDEGSQRTAALALEAIKSIKAQKVLDLCAGGGGKTLALAADLPDTTALFAYDSDKTRLAPIFQRLEKASADVTVIRAGDEQALKSAAPFDAILIDAPCTGSGTWRRHPETKWKLQEKHIIERQKQQAYILKNALSLLAPNGLLLYITCSIFQEETLPKSLPLKVLEEHLIIPHKEYCDGFYMAICKANFQHNSSS